ncbi:hypothetical protein AB0D42_27155 [Streptomyces sp. NPDC048304]
MLLAAQGGLGGGDGAEDLKDLIGGGHLEDLLQKDGDAGQG